MSCNLNGVALSRLAEALCSMGESPERAEKLVLAVRGALDPLVDRDYVKGFSTSLGRDQDGTLRLKFNIAGELDLSADYLTDLQEKQLPLVDEGRMRALAAIEEQFPAIKNAAKPVPVAPPSDGAACSLSATQVIHELADRVRTGTFQLRSSATTLEGLVGPFRAQGTCLEPFDHEGSLHWYDPRLPAQDGDVVLIAWGAREYERLLRSANGQDWLQKYGKPPGPIATKILKHFAGELYLVCKDSCFPLGGSRILGVLASWVRERPFVNETGQPAICTAQIGIEAATSTTTAYVASHTAVGNFGADTTWLTITTPAQSVDHTLQITTSMDIWKAVGTLQRTVEIFAVPSPGGPPFYGSAVRDITFTAAPGERVALQADFPALANTQYIVRIALASPGGGGGNTEVRDATLRTEHIKR